MINETKQLTPIAKLLEHQREIERTIHMYEQMFGTIIEGIYHEHHHTITYLKGRLDGIKFTMRTLDM